MSHRLVAVDHVQLAMPSGQEDEATAFYSGILGLDRQPKPPVLAARGGCWFSNGAVALQNLAVRAPPADDGTLARGNIGGGGAIGCNVGHDLRTGRFREARRLAFAHKPAVAHHVSCSDRHFGFAALC